MPKFGLATPFPVSYPCPVRFMGQAMIPDIAIVRHDTVVVTFCAGNESAGGWWNKRCDHEYTWSPKVVTVEAALEKHGRSIGLKPAARTKLIDSRRGRRCGGGGRVVFIDRELEKAVLGKAIVGGHASIYVVSPEFGTIRVPTSRYTHYDPRGFRITSESESADFPVVGKEPVAIPLLKR